MLYQQFLVALGLAICGGALFGCGIAAFLSPRRGVTRAEEPERASVADSAEAGQAPASRPGGLALLGSVWLILTGLIRSRTVEVAEKTLQRKRV